MTQENAPATIAAASNDEFSNTIRNHVIGSMGVGLIPVPIVDLVALTGIQLNLLRKLAQKYNVPFSNDKGKSVVAALVGGAIPMTFSNSLSSLIKGVPLIGQTTGALTMPILAGATTYAIAKVFTQHFASGGTFLNFDPDQVRDYYEEMFKEGQKVAREIKQDNSDDESDNDDIDL